MASWLKNILYNHINMFVYVIIVCASQSYALLESSLPYPSGNFSSFPTAVFTDNRITKQFNGIPFSSVIRWLSIDWWNKLLSAPFLISRRETFHHKSSVGSSGLFLAYVSRKKVRLWQFSWKLWIVFWTEVFFSIRLVFTDF